MARSRPHPDGGSGDLHHSAAVLLLFLFVSRELEGSEEEDRALPKAAGRKERFNASD